MASDAKHDLLCDCCDCMGGVAWPGAGIVYDVDDPEQFDNAKDRLNAKRRLRRRRAATLPPR